MSDYKDIKGLKVRYLASDPANPELGEVWYNSTTNVAKVQAYQTAAWATGGNMSASSGSGGMATAGSQTSFLAAMGAPGARNDTEQYNGTSWTAGGTVPYSASGVISFGTENETVVAGGQPGGGGVSTTSEYNGSSWANQGSLPYPLLYQIGGAGPGADGISIGGWNQTSPTGGAKTDVKVYNGSAWSTDPATCPFPAYQGAHYGAGSSDVNYFGGYNPTGRNANHANYNGTTFTALTGYPLGGIAGVGTAGTTTQALVWSGNDGVTNPPLFYVTQSNTWDGSAWTASANYPQQVQNVYSGGSSVPVAISSGGTTGSYQNGTFEYQAAGIATQTIGIS
jgi:hypothetical protein